MSDLNFSAGINRDQWRADIEAMRRDLLGLNNTVANETRKIDSSFKNLSLGIAGYFSVGAIKGFVSELINVRGEFQKTEIAFATMLGSSDKAKTLMGEMVNLAAKTPFSLRDVSDGAKQLLAFQVPANKVVDTLTRMGNIAAGLSVPIQRINLVYGQVKAKGKLMGDDLRQFTEAGIPMVAELAKNFGKSTAEIQAMVSAGKIGFADVQKVLFNLTNEGGMFYNLMEKQSASLSGQIANLEDTIEQMFNSIAEGQEGILNDGISAVTFLVENYQAVIDVLMGLVAVYGAYRTALIVNTAIVNVAAAREAGFTTAMMARLTITRLTTAATAQLNATMLANPVVLLITAIAGLTYAYFKLRDTTTQTERVQAKMSSTMRMLKKDADDLKNTTEQSLSVLKAEHSTYLQKYQAYQKLQTLYPDYLKNISMENFLKKETIEINKILAEAQEEYGKKAFGNQLKDSEARVNKLKAEINSLTNSLGKGSEASDITKLHQLAKKQKDLDSEIVKSQKLKFIQQERAQDEKVAAMSAEERQKYYQNEVDSLNKQLYQHKQKNKNWSETDSLVIKVGNSMANLKLTSVLAQIDRMNAGLKEATAQLNDSKKDPSERTKSDWEKIRDDAKAKLEGLNQKDAKGAEGAKARKEIADAEKQLEAWDIKTKQTKEKIAKDSKRQLAEVFDKGSIAELEQRISLWNEALNKAGSDNKVDVLTRDKFGDTKKTGETTSIEFAKKQVEELEKAKATRLKEIQAQNFDAEIAELERQWNVRYQIAEKYGKDVAKAQFPDLKGESYFDEIQKRFEDLNKKVSSGVSISDKDLEQWQKLKTILDGLNGVKDPLTNFKDFLDTELAKLSTFAEKIEFLNTKADSLSGEEKGRGYLAEINKINEAILNENENFYNQFLQEKETFEQKKAKIDEKYNSLDESIKSSNKSSGEKDRLLAESAKAKGKEYSQAFIEGVASSDMWQKAFGEINQMTNTEIRKNIEYLKEQLKNISQGNNVDPEKVKVITDQIKSLQGVLNDNPFSKIKDDYKKMMDVLNDPSSSLEKKLGAIQFVFNDLGAGVQMVGDAFGGFDEQTQDTIDNIMAIGNAALDLGKSIASGDVAGMIKAGIQLIASIGKALSGDNKKERQIKRQAAEVKKLENAYNQLERAINKALGERVFDASKAAIENLNQQKVLLEQMIKTENAKKKADQDKINDYKDKIQSINNAIEDMQQSMVDKALNGMDAKKLAQELGDALVAAFQNGEDAAGAMSKTVDKIMREMAINALKMQILEPAMQSVIDQMLGAMGYRNNVNKSQIDDLNEQLSVLQQQYNVSSLLERIMLKKQMDAIKKKIADLMSGNFQGAFDGLTEQEILDIKNNPELLNAITAFQNGLGAIGDIFGDINANASNLEGAIKGVSEETASIIAGQMNAIRIMQAEGLNIHKASQDIFRNQLLQLTQIEINTRYLKMIYDGLKEKGSLRGSGIIV